MTRLIIYVLLSLSVTLGAAWLIGLPGTITIDVVGYRLQPGLGASAAAGLALMALSIAVWAIIRRILEAPRNLARRNRARRTQVGIDALSDAFIALQAGDPARARLAARDAQLRLPENAAALLLEAQADLEMGDLSAAREHYRGLLSNPKTSLAALAGLYQQARAQGRDAAALTFAHKAAKLAPSLSWAEDAVFGDLTVRRAWREALDVVSARPAPTREKKALKRRQQTVLLTALAADCEPLEPEQAYQHATAALKLSGQFVPAALIAARILINRGETRKAQSLLRRVWRATGHPHVATLYANTQPGASAVERLKKVRELIDTPEPDLQAACVLARAAIDAFEWTTARNILSPYSAGNPTQNVCMLMAELEEGQNGDQGKAREWLSRAVRAPRDFAWTTDSIVAQDWEPASPVTGRLDAFEWKAPGPGTAMARPASPEDQGSGKARATAILPASGN